ncbi:hypothetical protein K438DRAFT_1851974 [Mycena galopus ATCC 62051]|nr:hypothetical protein K438DRAFT_1851974 [Mycena galopus ATCC 62051]
MENGGTRAAAETRTRRSTRLCSTCVTPRLGRYSLCLRHCTMVAVIYDPKSPTTAIGLSWVTDYSGHDVEDWQAHLARPLLPDGELLLYHQLWRALLRGNKSSQPCHARPALPVELVRLIVRAAGLVVPDSRQTCRAGRSVFIRVTIYDENPIASQVWFWTKPLRVAHIAAAQLVTVSRDQGWVNPVTDVCHSWFEWGVFEGSIPSEKEAGIGGGACTGNERAWTGGQWRRSHGNPVASRHYGYHSGPRVGMDDEMWAGTNLEAEWVSIAVRACAQQAAWENDSGYGEILVWKWFEPVVSVV